MSAAALKRLALGNGWQFEAWHLQVADQLAQRLGEAKAALAVFGIFGTAMLRNGIAVLGEDPRDKYLALQNASKVELARDYLPDVSAALGVPVHLGRPMFRDKGGAGRSIMQDTEFSRECRTRIERLKAKSLNKGVQL